MTIEDTSHADADNNLRFETIGQIIRKAQETLPPHSSAYAAAGGGEGATVARNRGALNRLAFRPRVLRDVREVDTSMTFLGRRLSLPVMLAPVGALSLFDDKGCVAAAYAASEQQTLSFVGTLAEPSYADAVKAAGQPQVFQLYPSGDRGWIRELLERVTQIGCLGVCITVDTSVASYRDVLAEHGYDWRMERTGEPPNLRGLGRDRKLHASYTWTELEWLRSLTDLPIILKGVMDPQDAARATSIGVDTVYVSNHGGRTLDHCLSTMEVLPRIVDVIEGQCEVIVDGGILRGTDVCKAISLGAAAVLIGRLQCWALGAGGQGALSQTLGILRREVETVLGQLGCTSLQELSKDRLEVTFSLMNHPYETDGPLSGLP